MRQKGRMEMNAMFSLLSFLYFAYISACFTPQTKEIRKYQIARYNVVQNLGLSVKISRCRHLQKIIAN